jgi:ATP-binding cassette subfamily B protein/subfamily B ATP-binding cassette protein MsbA
VKTILRIIGLAKPWTKFIVFGIFALVIVSAMQLAMPMLVRDLLTRISDGDLTLEIILTISAALLGIHAVRILFQFVYDYFSHIAGFNLNNRLRQKTYDHIQNFSPRWFSDKSTGQVVTRLGSDCDKMEVLVSHNLPDLFTSILIFAGALALLIFINPVMTAFVCIPLPLIFLTSFLVRKIRKQYVLAKSLNGEMLGDITDNIQGMKEIQVFNKQEYETAHIARMSGGVKNAMLRATVYRALINPIVVFMNGLGYITIILCGGIMAMHGDANAADITAFLLYIGMIYMPIMNLARIYEDTQDSLTSGKRIFEILDAKSEIIDLPNARDVGMLSGNIEFKNVSFKYSGEMISPEPPAITEQPILNNISFTIPHGKMVALVGATGAGKSTIASLLVRFYDPTNGAVSIDGVDLRDMTIKSLRQNISMVLQDVFLFNGTIYENIAYGADGAAKDQVETAARMACIDDFIKTLPKGYETVVGERGTRLSGGQKQRVALARAILRESPILILDEATSAIDNETERIIQTAIAKLAHTRTILVIAHRLSTIERADEIIYLENGEIRERGNHAELLKRGGAYAKLALRASV